MVQSKNVVHAHNLHKEWNADSLVFCFVKSKGNQTRQNSDQEWHVYANPHNPKICPVLALASYIFSNPGIFSSAVDNKVVEWRGMGTQKDTYSLEETSTTDSWTACTVLWRSISKSLCIGYLAWLSEIALGKEMHKQLCLY